MNFADRITHMPLAFDNERGQEIRQLFEGTDSVVTDVLAGAAGSSPYLFSILQRETDWVRAAIEAAPETGFAAILADVAQLPAPGLADGLRVAKRRVAVLVALADLAGVWDLGDVTGALTRFADLAVDVCVKSLVGAEIDRDKLPGATEADKATAGGMVVLAMGKMGAAELNYSSDIDLICLFDETRFSPKDYGDARTSFIRVTRRMTALLSDLTHEGYVFRTDLRLRPDPSATPVCLSMEAAAQYYESVGRTWERAAHIKARPCGGDLAAGWSYLKYLRPFIWRRHLDFAAIQDAHDMRLRIRSHKGFRGSAMLEGHNMKLGSGGIREIEFFTQTRQIIAGGRDESLRVRGTCDGLDRLAAKDWVPGEVAAHLKEDYRAHRQVEHRLQMVNDAQTHDLPKTPEGFARLAALSGVDTQKMCHDLRLRLDRVAELTEGFFSPASRTRAPEPIPAGMADIVARWGTYPSLRSARAVQIFERLKPDILRRLQTSARPDQALIQFDGFLAGLPAGVQVFSLFEANPQLIDLIVDIAATAPRLAQYLGRNAQVFDAVIGGDFFAPWPGSDALLAHINTAIGGAGDYEGKLDAARRVKKEWHFRTGVHYLRGLISAGQAGREYAALADCVLRVIWPLVQAEFSAKHGQPPGRGAAVLAMGSLGAGQLTAASDLDLIVIYDAAGVESSDGDRPLATRPYYARLTQSLVTALSAQMAEGRLYEVDMRLRPSGRQGPVATSLAAFKAYQIDEAWTWEHLALTRARPVVGNKALGADINGFRENLLAQKSEPKQVLADVVDMRARIAAAGQQVGDWQAKLGTGRLQDIELLAQTAALLAGDPARSVADQIAAGVRIGWLGSADARHLLAAYDLMWRLQSATRLLGSDGNDPTTLGQGGLEFLLRESGTGDADGLTGTIATLTATAADIVDNSLGGAENLT